jgi:tetratricopeptide (TPR) repeat protein
MLDIHGYTQFCMDSRKNLSMMHSLDWAMNTGSRRISSACQAVSQRERGDEVVVVAASATDALTVTLAIIDFFGKTNVVNDPKIPTGREGKSDALPIFKISAGITGGNTQSPLIITEKGNLSGFLLNSGARLQTRANELSGKESRVMIAKQVYMNYMKENEKDPCELFKRNAIYFLDTGQIEFKGVQIPSCEAVFEEKNMYKEKFSGEMIQLFNSTKENLWEQRIYQDLMSLISRAAQVMPKFTIVPPSPINGMQTITNDSFQQICRHGMKAYIKDEDYAEAVSILRTFVSLIEQIPNFERLILDYLKGITNKYEILLEAYLETIDKEIDSRAQAIFQQGNYYKAWLAAKNAITVYEKLKNMGRKSDDIPKKKVLWYNLIKQRAELMEFVLHSGKK